MCADINLEAAQETCELSKTWKREKCTQYTTHAIKVDVKSEEGVKLMVEETKQLFQRIDYFVNTAGVSHFRIFFSGHPHMPFSTTEHADTAHPFIYDHKLHDGPRLI